MTDTTPQAPSVQAEREAFITWMTTKHPEVYTIEDAEHYWKERHVSALAWQAGRAPLLAQLSRLQADNEALRDSVAAKADRIDRLGEMVERLQAGGGEGVEEGDDCEDLERWAAVADNAACRWLKAHPPAAPAINYTPGQWHKVNTPEELEAFFLSRLPAIRDAARECGYAIGLHGSLRRDFDLIAAPWRDAPADKDVLAHAIANAACGITRDGDYDWSTKPLGRMATSIPCCWPSWHGVTGLGHIDLSVTPAAPALPPEADADCRQTVIWSLMASKSWTKDYAEAYVDAWLDGRGAAPALVPLTYQAAAYEFNRRNEECTARGFGNDVPMDLTDFALGAQWAVAEFCRINGLTVGGDGGAKP